MLTIHEAREWLRIDNPDNDAIINELLVAIPNYIEVSTGMNLTQQNSEPLVYTASKFILQLWYNAEQSEAEKLQKVIDSLLKAITLKVNRSN